MLGTLAQAFRTPDLRKKLLFTLGMIVLFRFGSNLPAPGISEQNVRYCSGLASGSSPVAGIYAMLNVLSGNSLLHVTVFALTIMPYITASIIVQLLTQVVPRLEKLKNEGQAGTAKITQPVPPGRRDVRSMRPCRDRTLVSQPPPGQPQHGRRDIHIGSLHPDAAHCPEPAARRAGSHPGPLPRVADSAWLLVYARCVSHH
jgi:hypothetical protein